MTLGMPWPLVLSCVLLLSACGSDSSPTQAGGPDSISAIIGGEAWSVSAPFASAELHESILFRVTTVDLGATYRMTITLGEFEGEGTYEIRPGIPLRMAVVTPMPIGAHPGWRTEYAVSPGVVTITSITETRVQGTFSFTADLAPDTGVTETLVVQQGQFDLPLFRIGN